MCVSCLCIYSSIVCLLIRTSSLLKFKEIIERYILLLFFYLLLLCFCSSFLFISFSVFPCDLMTSFSVMFGFISLFCAPIINFWFTAIMRFLYSNLHLHVIILSCFYLLNSMHFNNSTIFSLLHKYCFDLIFFCFVAYLNYLSWI